MADIRVDLKLDKTGFDSSASKASASVDALKKNLNDVAPSLQKGVGGAFKSLQGGVGGLLSSLGPLKGILAGIAGVAAFKEIISSAIEADKAVNDVANSLARAGEFSQDALKDVQDFAGELQDLTGLGDDTTLAMISLAQSFGLSKDQAKETVRVAADLSAATGKDLKTSVEGLSAAYNGNVGKLAKLNPALKELTDEQLKAGAAAKILGDQFAGAAASQLNTFGGALGAASTRFGDISEGIGQIVTQSPAMIEIVRTADKVFKSLVQVIGDNSSEIRSFVKTGVSVLVKSFGTLAQGMSNAIEIFRVLFNAIIALQTAILGLVEAFYRLEFVQTIIRNVLKAFAFLGEQITSVISKLAKLPGVSSALSTLGLDAEGIADAFTGMSLAAEEFGSTVTGSEYADAIGKLKDKSLELQEIGSALFDGASQGLIDAKTAAEELAAKIDKLPDSVTIDVKNRSAASGGEGYTQTSSGEFVGPPAPSKDSQSGSSTGQVTSQEMGSIGEDIGKGIAKAFADNLLGGKEGARKFLGSAAGAVADAFAPGLGAVVGPFVEALSQGPEFVKTQLNAFVDALPELIDAIVEAIPVFIEVLAERAPDIIVALVNGVPRIAAALATALLNPMLYVGVARGLAQAAVQGLAYQFGKLNEALTNFQNNVSEGGKKFAEFFKSEVPNAIKSKIGEAASAVKELFTNAGKGFANSIKDLAKQFIDALVSEIRGALGNLNPFKGGGGGQGPVEGALGVDIPGVGFATGGMITGHGNRDTVPTMMTPGELVIDRTTGPRLMSFIDSFDERKDQSEDNSLTLTMLAQVVELLKQPVQVQTTAEVDGRSLADIFLTLTRSNQRLT